MGFLLSRFGAADVLSAVKGAHVSVLVLVVLLGVLLQVLRAERARRLLSRGHTVSLAHSYGPMVVGHGIGDLVPLAPGGPALRCVLTERVANVPIGFSAGAFLSEGILDGLGLALLSSYLLLAVTVPSTTRVMLILALGQIVLLFGLLIGARAVLRRGGLNLDASGEARPWRRFGRQLVLGVTTVFGQGLGTALSIVGLSLLVTALNGLQIVLFLHAFNLQGSPRALVLIVVLTLTAGSVPIKFPGSGTITAAAILTLAGLHGGGSAGYVLVSRTVFSSETTVLALLLLGWWGITGYSRRYALVDVLSKSMHRPARSRRAVEPSTVSAAQRPAGMFSIAVSSRRLLTRVVRKVTITQTAWSRGTVVLVSALGLGLVLSGAVAVNSYMDPDLGFSPPGEHLFISTPALSLIGYTNAQDGHDNWSRLQVATTFRSTSRVRRAASA